MTASRRSVRILVAEDDLLAQKIIRLFLERNHHVVTMVANGVAVLAALDEGVFDLILMDVQMPELDGMATTRAIRQRELASGGHIPIVALTVLATPGERARCLEAGMDAFITKTVGMYEIARIVNSLVRREPPAVAVGAEDAVPLCE